MLFSSSPCLKCDTLQRNYEQEREQRLQTEKDNERLRDVVSRQKHEHELNSTTQDNVEILDKFVQKQNVLNMNLIVFDMILIN